MRPSLHHYVKTDKTWRLIDGKGMKFGDATKMAARLLAGKHKVTFEPSVFNYDPVVVINVKLLEFANRRYYEKALMYHSGWPGGLKKVAYNEMMKKTGAVWTKPFKRSVLNQLPRWPNMRYFLLTKLYLFPYGRHHFHNVKLERVPNMIGTTKHFGLGGEPSYSEMEDMFVRLATLLPEELLERIVNDIQSSDPIVSKAGLDELIRLTERTELGDSLRKHAGDLRDLAKSRAVTPLPMDF